MITTKENNGFRCGLADGLPIGIGYLSVSFAFGIFAVGCGLSPWQALLISMLNLTSAGQLAGAPIIAAGGSAFELALTQLVINLRYSLMSVSLSQRLGKSVRSIDRFFIAFGNTDEIFAVSMGRGEPLGRRYFRGIIIPPFVGWSLGTVIGAVCGNILPQIVISALGIAIYAMFVAIVVPVARKSADVLFAVLSAILLSCAFYYLPGLRSVPSGFVIVICAVAVSALFAFIRPINDGEVDDNE